MKNKDKILLGILGAAAAGVAIGLLFYTEGGKKTRKKIKSTTDEWTDSLSSLLASGKESLSDFSHKALDKAKAGLHKAKRKTEDTYSDYSDEFADRLS